MTDNNETNTRALDALDELLAPLGMSRQDAGGDVSITGGDPLFPGALRLGETFTVAAMGAAVGAAAIWRERTGEGQDLSVDVREAAHGINPDLTFHPTVNGHPYPNWVGNFHPFGIVPFQTRDGRWIYPSAVYPPQQLAWGKFFNSGTSMEQIGAAIAKWDALELEDAANAEGHTVCIARTAEEWAAHPQGQYLGAEPAIAVRKVGDSAAEPLLHAARPLSGINVLSLTHAVAGPVAGRTLAEHGANVLCVNNQEFEHDWVFDDSNAGQRSTFLDLKIPEDNARCRELAQDADVFIDNFRSRKMADFGFSPEELAERRPGIIVLNVRCYGWDGPWAERGGFDMLGSAASGLAMADGTDGRPALPSTGLLNDYITGYLGAAGIEAALLRRAREGGSYQVTVSLTRTAMWSLSLGLVPEAERIAENPLRMIAIPAADGGLTSARAAEIFGGVMGLNLGGKLHDAQAVVSETPLGTLRRLAPTVTCSKTPARWRDPILVHRGSSKPYWF
jgi:crotonobetainyl-CoA:carnitine CoA-transferase CaiB-like acyl-CoA transferase